MTMLSSRLMSYHCVMSYFITGGSHVCKETEVSLIHAAKFIGVDPGELQEALVSRVMQASRGGVKGTVIK